jgi:hypothetical protein
MKKPNRIDMEMMKIAIIISLTTVFRRRLRQQQHLVTAEKRKSKIVIFL